MQQRLKRLKADKDLLELLAMMLREIERCKTAIHNLRGGDA